MPGCTASPTSSGRCSQPSLPSSVSRSPQDVRDQARLAWQLKGLGVRGVADVTRLFSMSVADLLEDYFESPQMLGVLSVSGVIGTWAGPRSPGTAFVMAHHKIGDVGDGELGSWGFPEGGMGGLTQAMASAARSFGAEIRTEAPVARILTTNGQVNGVALVNGDELTAPLVVTTLHPQAGVPAAARPRRAARRLRRRHRALEHPRRGP